MFLTILSMQKHGTTWIGRHKRRRKRGRDGRTLQVEKLIRESPICNFCFHHMRDENGNLIEWGSDAIWYEFYGNIFSSQCDDCVCGACGSRKIYPGAICC